MQTIQLIPKGRKRLDGGHPWIYRSDLKGDKPTEAGIVKIIGHKNDFLAYALFSPNSEISLRILTRSDERIDNAWFQNKIREAINLRRLLKIPSNAVRQFFGESDGIPALIVDQFNDVVSFQTLCAGTDRYKDDLINILWEELRPSAIVERNDVPVRSIEKLPMIAKVIRRTSPDTTNTSVTETIINEGNLKFLVDILKGQKTGAYLDQRSNRMLAGQLAYGSVLDCFSYEGWFALHMAQNSDNITCVDSSKNAISMISQNFKMNNLSDKINTIESNCFDFLRHEDKSGASYDCINLDPPPFVKSARDRESGYRGYKEINLRAMKLLRPKGLLITSSCSHHFKDEDFDEMLAHAACDAKVTAQVIYRLSAAPDHPVLATFPESHYLKCRIVMITAAI